MSCSEEEKVRCWGTLGCWGGSGGGGCSGGSAQRDCKDRNKWTAWTQCLIAGPAEKTKIPTEH